MGFFFLRIEFCVRCALESSGNLALEIVPICRRILNFVTLNSFSVIEKSRENLDVFKIEYYCETLH